MTRYPLVSVVVSTHNRFERLMRALASVRNQTYPNLEVIVVNDGSTQREYSEIAHSDDTIWVDLQLNTRITHGFPCLGYVRNVGIAHATGEYLAFLDDDDVWLPQKIAAQVEAIHGTNVRMCCTEVYASDGAPGFDLEYPTYYRDTLALDLPPFLTAEHVSAKNYVTHSSVLLLRELFDQVGPYDELPLQGATVDGVPLVEDWELWRACFTRTRCRYLSEPLVYYDCKFGKLAQPCERLRIGALRLSRRVFGWPERIRIAY